MNLNQRAEELASRLADTHTQVVFAESCTSGLVAAALAAVPGISEWMCGSAVVYREETKAVWLGIDREVLKEHSAVSAQVTQDLAVAVLKKTPEADLAVAITGHLGPNAPADLDGVVYIAVYWRGEVIEDVVASQFRLLAQQRVERQREAATRVLSEATSSIHRRFRSNG
ncbi:CinA family protein [Novipirellula herctigrandis]